MTTPRHIRTVRERTIFWALCALALVSVILYANFLQGAVRAVVLRERAIEERVLATARVGELEARYSGLQNSLNLEYAYAHGFVDADSLVFVSRLPFDRALSLNTTSNTHR
jgi:hypothetical protein